MVAVVATLLLLPGLAYGPPKKWPLPTQRFVNRGMIASLGTLSGWPDWSIPLPLIQVYRTSEAASPKAPTVTDICTMRIPFCCVCPQRLQRQWPMWSLHPLVEGRYCQCNFTFFLSFWKPLCMLFDFFVFSFVFFLNGCVYANNILYVWQYNWIVW